MLSHLQRLFHADLNGAPLAFHLLPGKVHDLAQEEPKILEDFQSDLQLPSIFRRELHRWKQENSAKKPKDKNKELVEQQD